jgi:hypothetical protein
LQTFGRSLGPARRVGYIPVVNASRQPGGRSQPLFVRAIALTAAVFAAAAGVGCTPKPQLLPEARAEKVADEAERREQLAQAPPPPTDVEALRTKIAEEKLNVQTCHSHVVLTSSEPVRFWFALYGIRTLKAPRADELPKATPFMNQWGPETDFWLRSPFTLYTGVDLARPLNGLINYFSGLRGPATVGSRLFWHTMRHRCREDLLQESRDWAASLPNPVVMGTGESPPPADDPLTDKLKTMQGKPSTPWNTDPANSAPQGPALPLRDVRPQNDNPR